MNAPEQIRRDFAAAWGRVGAAWGVTPSTAAVQGYLLLHGGPLTEAEIRTALGLSHRAALLALADCERWGLIEPSGEPRRTGRRGPAARAWVPVGDHWEWFRRVAAARKERETDPLLPILEECLRRAQEAEATGPEGAELRTRISVLLDFVHDFDRGVGAVVRTDAAVIARVFGVLSRLDDDTLDRLIAALGELDEEELARAATAVARLRPSLRRRLLSLVSQPGVARLLGA